jgi:hypothetical protein
MASERKRRAKPAARYLLVILSIALVSTALTTLPGRILNETDLLDRSRRIASTDTWFVEYDCYRWASHDRVAALLKDTPLHWEAKLLEVSSGAHTPFKQFNRMFESGAMTDVLRWDISPDCRWVVAAAGSDSSPRWVVSGLDESTRSRSWPRERSTDTHCFWSPDSTAWYTCDSSSSKRLRVVEHGVESDSIQSQDLEVPVNHRVLGFTHRGRLLAAQLPSSSGLELREFGFDRTQLHGREWKVPFPLGAEVTDLSLSPDGKRLAVITAQKVGNGNRQWSRIASLLGYSPRAITYTVWVCPTFSKDAVSVGRLSQNAVEEKTDPGPWNLRWAPGYRGVSFIYRGGFYVAPSN